MRVPDLPRAIRHPDEDQRLQTLGIDLPRPHLGLDGVPRGGVARLAARQDRDLVVGVGKLQIDKRLQLGAQVPVAIVGPPGVDAGAFVNRDVGMVERGQFIEVLGQERGVVGLEPGLDGRRVRGGVAPGPPERKSPTSPGPHRFASWRDDTQFLSLARHSRGAVSMAFMSAISACWPSTIEPHKRRSSGSVSDARSHIRTAPA